MRGKVVTWRHERGYGFIAPHGGPENVFVHISQIRGEVGELFRGDEVEFEVGTSARTGKTEAQQVRLVE